MFFESVLGYNFDHGKQMALAGWLFKLYTLY